MSDMNDQRRARDVTCERCGTVFTCNLSGKCWCASMPFRLPLPDADDDEGFKDCLCKQCMEAIAQGR
jgi:hypothetical protein